MFLFLILLALNQLFIGINHNNFESIDGSYAHKPYMYYHYLSHVDTDVSKMVPVSIKELARSTLVKEALGVIKVTTQDELLTALKAATGGEVIELAPGQYGKIKIYDGRNEYFRYPEQVTIKSADPQNPAVIGNLFIKGGQNLLFEDLVFKYGSKPGAHVSVRTVHLVKSQSVTIRANTFRGDNATGKNEIEDGFATGIALGVRESTDILIEDNFFTTWHRGAVFSKSTNVVVRGNEVTGMRSDGFNFAAIKGLLVEGNKFHDFRGAAGSGDHMDMIQFWTNRTDVPSSDIVIRGNILDSNEGNWTQSIYLYNEEVARGRAGDEMYYQNILIEENVIRNAHSHGIFVGEAEGVTIRQNTLVHNATTGNEASVNVPKITVLKGAREVTVIRNVLPKLNIKGVGQPGWDISDNLEIQRLSADSLNYQGDLFVDGLSDHGDVLHDLTATPGGLIETKGLGAGILRLGRQSEVLIGNIEVETNDGLAMLETSFKIGALIGPNGAIDENLILSVKWQFGDGQTESGASVQYVYLSGGIYDTQADIALVDGRMVKATKTIFVDSPVAVAATFETGVHDISDIQNTVLAGTKVVLAAGAEGLGLDLTNQVVTYKADSGFIGNKEYSVLIDFNTDGTAAGRLVTFSGSFILDAGTDYLRAAVITEDAVQWIRVDGLDLSDDVWHQLALTFDGDKGVAVLYLDRLEVGRIEGLEGAVQVGNPYHDLHLGNPNQKSFTGMVDNFQFLRGARSAEDLTERGG